MIKQKGKTTEKKQTTGRLFAYFLFFYWDVCWVGGTVTFAILGNLD